MKFKVGDRVFNNEEERRKGYLLLGTVVAVYRESDVNWHDIQWDTLPLVRCRFSDGENSLYTHEDFEDKIKDRL